jgi:hypothetical protein
VNDRAVRKYLARWAEPEAALAGAIEATYDEVVVVPARRERATLADDLRDWTPGSGRALVVLVENESELRAQAVPPVPRARIESGAHVDLLRVDRVSPGQGLPPGEGVGRARKIGGDIALALAARGGLASPWIHMTDADARLEAERFRIARRALDETPEAGAVVLPYRHEAHRESLAEPMRRHEIWLRYHVLGLAAAGSPYAFPSIGSVIAVRPDTYAIVRGVPNREAGEDFHFLDKVAKTRPIVVAAGEPVVLEARCSDRVPFGTGPALTHIASELEGGREMRVLDPACYAGLAVQIAALDRLAGHGDPARFVEETKGALAAAAETIGMESAVVHLTRKYAHGAVLRRHLHTWFDGLRTLRFLHALRDGGIVPVPWDEALRRAHFLQGFDDVFDAMEAVSRLQALEQGSRVRGLGALSEGS